MDNVKTYSDLWAEVLKIIKSSVNTQTFQTWFSFIEPVSFTGDTLIVQVPNQFFKSWILEHYIDTIKNSLRGVTGRDIELEFHVFETQQEKRAITEKIIMDTRAHIQTPTQFLSFSNRYKDLGLNPKYTFESFVIGPSNRFTHAAALAIVDSLASAYNPLFIYGGVGLGKTHLMHAIAHGVAQRYPQAKILYISSEKFTNHLISAIQNRTTIKFRQLYRSVDILLIDDVHFIAGKESTQEEFFHTFNALHENHKQIILSSDRSPKNIPGLEERLVSRFEWGLVTDIQPPDLETRIAILKKKSERETIQVPNDVLFYIAEKIKSNIRELEGALIRVVAYAKLNNINITLDIAKDVLRDMIIEEEKKVTIELIQKKVAEYFDIRLSDMKAKKRSKVVVYPRQIAMYISRELTTHSLPEIGEQFGGRDHTTVLHAYEKIREELTSNPTIKGILNKLVFEIKNY
ncbi:MAG: chromosomal replication initiator protein DnaA [Candidatus Omnitrophica bacterium]|nr:chromosomal replication initiator protein DnaA [Candidatus Omnitrophota bacterium]